MKLAQRLLIGYYKTRLRTLALVSPRRAARLAFSLFCTPFDHKIPANAPPAFRNAQAVSFPLGDYTIRGFRFIPPVPNGKKTMVVHGFRSHSYKFEAYLLTLCQQGFEVFAFDAPAHGLSSGTRINAYIYKQLLEEAERLYGPFYGLMGHSFGALAAALFFEALPDKTHRRLVLVAPVETETALDHFCHRLQVQEKIRRIFRLLIEETTGYPLSYYSVGRVVQNLSEPVLWVHDTGDQICPFSDVEPIRALHLAHVRFRITEGLGHSRIYKEAAIKEEITRFFTEGIS